MQQNDGTLYSVELFPESCVIFVIGPIVNRHITAGVSLVSLDSTAASINLRVL